MHPGGVAGPDGEQWILISEVDNNLLTKTEMYSTFVSRGEPGNLGPHAAQGEGGECGSRTTQEASRRGGKFFYFFARNPLKSPDSKK
jgi:hypothetical protein